MDIDSQDNVAGEDIRPRHHESLWFDDGNVVLATDKYLFRVHKSVLSSHSAVFRDMFGLPTVNENGIGGHAGGMEPEMYQGLPLVTLAGDKGDDVAHLLRATYERRYYVKDNDDEPLEKLTALLILSSKYEFKDLRYDVITHLRDVFPTRLRTRDRDRRLGRCRCLGDDGEELELIHFTLLQAAYTANVEILLPVLYYECAFWTTAYIIDELADLLPVDCLKILLRGKDVLSSAITPLVANFIERALACAHQDQKRAVGPLMRLRSSLQTCSLMSVSLESLVTQFPGGICDECWGPLKIKIDEDRESIWDNIPSFFGLPSWDVLQSRYDEL